MATRSQMSMGMMLLLLLTGGSVYGDDIYAKQGSTPMARDVLFLEKAGGKYYFLDKRLKRRALDESMVGRVEKKRCVLYEYKEREALAKDADGTMALAAWALEKRFHKDVIRMLHERALALDPNHEGANLALGRIRYEGRWMTPGERTRRQAEEAEAAQRAKGLVKYKGEWVTPEDQARLERGLVKFNGRWMTVDQMKQQQGFVRYEGQWVRKDDLAVLKLIGPARKATGLGAKLVLVQTPRCAVMGDLAPEQLKQLAAGMEKLFTEWLRLFPSAKGTDLLAGKYRLFAFKKSRPYTRLVKALYKRQKEESNWSGQKAKIEEARMRARLKETSFWEIWPHAYSAHVQMPDPFEGLRAHCVHFGANVLATRHLENRFPTWWLNEGVAYYLEQKVTGTIQTYNANVGGGGGYANQGSLDTSKMDPWIDATKWKDLLLNLVRTGRDPQLEKIKGKQLYGSKNRLHSKDLAKSLSVVTFLIRDDGRKFAAFFKEVKTMSGGSPVEIETAAMIKHYGSYREVEARWKEYALNGFKIVR